MRVLSKKTHHIVAYDSGPSYKKYWAIAFPAADAYAAFDWFTFLKTAAFCAHKIAIPRYKQQQASFDTINILHENGQM